MTKESQITEQDIIEFTKTLATPPSSARVILVGDRLRFRLVYGLDYTRWNRFRVFVRGLKYRLLNNKGKGKTL